MVTPAPLTSFDLFCIKSNTNPSQKITITMSAAATTTQFDSEGFDLSAIATDGDDEDVKGGRRSVVYEIGGGITIVNESQPKKAKEASATNGNANTTTGDDGNNISSSSSSPIDESERLKELGNQDFKLGNHLDAYDYYTDAIEACPYGDGFGPSGKEMLKLREEFDEQNRERMMEKQRQEMNKRREKRNNDNINATSSTSTAKVEEVDDVEEEKDRPIDPFVPPRHIYGPKLAVYYANRAACLLHLGRNGEVIEDCDIALLYNPTYTKAYLRRCTAQERVENTEEALKDARMALQLEPNNNATRKLVSRLETIENQRLEKLKEETMGKLKDLGNSLLSNFGLSLDNFNAVQDPKTGGYSISFNQNGKK
jgi:tetratricopeptide (TPR) repeat protein